MMKMKITSMFVFCPNMELEVRKSFNEFVVSLKSVGDLTEGGYLNIARGTVT